MGYRDIVKMVKCLECGHHLMLLLIIVAVMISILVTSAVNEIKYGDRFGQLLLPVSVLFDS
jgi:hypothetical protein